MTIEAAIQRGFSDNYLPGTILCLQQQIFRSEHAVIDDRCHRVCVQYILLSCTYTKPGRIGALDGSEVDPILNRRR